MAVKSLTELVHELQLEVSTLKAQLAVLDERVGAAGSAAVRERLAVVEQVAADVKQRAEEADRRGERLAVVESQVAELKTREEEGGRKRWQVTVVFIGSLLTLAIQFALLFVKK